MAAKGFATQVHPAFKLIPDQVARVDFQLKVGQSTETVEVSSAAPLLQTDSTEVGTVIGEIASVDLPLASRDINQFALLSPGVVSPNIFAFQANQTTFGTGRPYVNGAREQDDNFSLDGMDANQADNNDVGYVPSPDAIQDFTLIAGNAPADFGNYMGGVIVETLKSGTNSTTATSSSSFATQPSMPIAGKTTIWVRRAIPCTTTTSAGLSADRSSRTSFSFFPIFKKRVSIRRQLPRLLPRFRRHSALVISPRYVLPALPVAFATPLRNSSTIRFRAQTRRPVRLCRQPGSASQRRGEGHSRLFAFPSRLHFKLSPTQLRQLLPG